MTDLLHDVDAPSDAELISRVRGGDVAAYGDLFSRHVDAAKRLARQLVRGPDADDLVSDAFARVLSVLQGGGGPDVAFRAYLLTAVRRLHVDKIRSGARLQTSDDMEAFDAGVPFQDTAVAAFESGAAAKAFASLPERWQLVLWHLEVEGQKPADIAPLLGMSPNSVSALAYRAREGLRQAFLTMHLNDISETDCRWVNEHLGAYVRNGLAKRDSVKVRAHLDDCRRCTAMYLELTEVNSNLAAIIAPLLLGAAATGYLASAGGAAGGFGLSAVFGRVRDLVSANAGAATAGAVAAGVAAVATAGIMLLPSSSAPDAVVGADRPITTVSTPPAAADGNDKSAADKKNQKPASSKTTDGPAVLLPSELPSVSESPAPDAIVALDPGTTTTGTETGTGGNTSDGTPAGGTSNSPGGQTSTPTEPTPTEPAPSEPTEPAPTEPAPTEPAPTEPAPTEPAPTEPAPVTYVLEVGPASITNGEVTFDVTGTPELPPTVYLKIDSGPAGIVFAGDGTCKVRLEDATVAVCDTAPAIAVASLARTLMAASATSFPVTMPLGGNPTKTTDVTITLSAPEDKVLQTVTTQYVVAPPTTVDAVLTLPDAVTTSDVHEYVIPATVSVPPEGYQGDATFTIASTKDRASFVTTDGCDVPSDPHTLICTSLPADGTVPLHVYVKDNSEDTDVEITLAPISADDDPSNNTASTVLKAVRPAVDVKLALTKDISGNAGKATATATVTGAPAEGAALTVGFDPDGVTFTKQPDSCSTSARSLTCEEVQNGTSLTFEVALVERPSNFSTETVRFTATPPAAYDEADASDNTDDLVVPRLQGAGSTASSTTDSSLLRTAADGSSSPALVDQGAGSDSRQSGTLRKTARKVDLLSETRPHSTSKADAPAKQQHQAKEDRTHKDHAKGDKGKHKGAGHERAKPASHKKDHAAKQNAEKHGDKPADAEQRGGDHGGGHEPGDDPGNGGDHGGKAEPGPVQRVISAAADLLL